MWSFGDGTYREHLWFAWGTAGATLAAVAARKLEDAEAFADDLGCARAYGGDNAYADICADPEM